MANGYCPNILRSIQDVANGNAPGSKMTIAGFLAMLFCCQNSTVSPVNDGNGPGSHYRPMTVWFYPRPTLDNVSTTDNCDVNDIPVREEFTIPTLGYAQTSWFIPDDEIQKYCEDASDLRSFGPTTLMSAHYENWVSHANILIRKINQQLVTSMSTQFGVNVATGSAGGKVINIARNANGLILDNGYLDIMNDLEANEFCGDPCIVGGGIFSAFNRSLAIACCSAAGMDLSRLNVPRFFYDKDTQSIWGDNTIGVFAPGSVKFLGRNRYLTPFGGDRGDSLFFSVPFPVSDFGCNNDACLDDLIIDVQVRYITCPQDIEVDGETTPVGRGIQVILSKYYALFVQPDDLYPDGDELEGTNGTLLYFIENTDDDGGSTPYTG